MSHNNSLYFKNVKMKTATLCCYLLVLSSLLTVDGIGPVCTYKKKKSKIVSYLCKVQSDAVFFSFFAIRLKRFKLVYRIEPQAGKNQALTPPLFSRLTNGQPFSIFFQQCGRKLEDRGKLRDAEFISVR